MRPNLTRVHTRTPLEGVFLCPRFALCVRACVRTDPGVRACVCVCMYTRRFSAVLRDFLPLIGTLTPNGLVVRLESLLSASVCLQWWGAVVVCGAGWCVWACIVRPSRMTGGGCGAVGAPSGAVCTYACLRKHACVHARLRTCARVRPNAQTCVRSCVRTHPRLRPVAFGCARASAPILYYPHPDYFSAIFSSPLFPNRDMQYSHILYVWTYNTNFCQYYRLLALLTFKPLSRLSSVFGSNHPNDNP